MTSDNLYPIILSYSVRDFVSPVERSGDIDMSYAHRMEEDALQAGTLAHQRVQRILEGIPGYRREVTVKHELHGQRWHIALAGRIDGIFERDGGSTIVEEIKASLRADLLESDLEKNPEHPYALQAKMYAWMHWVIGGRGPFPRCRLRLVSLTDNSESLFELDFDPEEFGRWVEAQAEALVAREVEIRTRLATRRDMVEKFSFPFPVPRPGQTELVDAVRRTVADRSRLMVQAPTGLGKTMGCLYPALEEAFRSNLRVFYATPRNSQHQLAEEVVKRLRSNGLDVRSVTIRSKEKVCLREEVHCNPKVCEYAAGYYDRVRENRLLQRLAEHGSVDAETIQQWAVEHTVCPFELSLDASLRADVVICDYNYVLSPNATLQRFFSEPEDCQRNVVLIDEAHNLYARAMEWFSPALGVGFLKGILDRKTAIANRALRSRYRKVVKACLELVESYAGESRYVDIADLDFYEREEILVKLMGEAAAKGEELTPQDPLSQLTRTWQAFCDVLRMKRKEFLHTWKPDESGGRLQITCADASFHLAPRIRQLASLVSFSATLKPFEFHSALCGLGEPETLEFPSPFSVDQRKILIVPQISTAWKDRDSHAPRIAEVISRVLPLRRGNYFIFFPSFQFLEKVLAHVQLPGFELVVQPRGATPQEVDALLGRLEVERNLVLFAVQGGSFAEGIDCPGEKLIGVIVVGPPLPPYDLEREGLREFYEKKYESGFNYAYVFPAMAKVAQSAGRVIRTDTDRGLVMLLDRRFLFKEYAKCMPTDWYQASPNELVSGAILKDVSGFWENCANE